MKKLETVSPHLNGVPVADRLTPAMADQIDTITADLDTAMMQMSRDGLGARSHQVRTMSNNLTSYADALRSGDANLAMLRDIETRVSAFDAEVATINTEWTGHTGNRPVGEFASSIGNLERALARVNVDRPDPDATETLVRRDISAALAALSARDRVIKSSFPHESVKDFSFLRLPVVMISNRTVNVERLAEMGFKVSTLYGKYPMVEDQIILAIRGDYARSYFGGYEKRGGDSDAGVTMAREILADVHESAGEELVLASPDSRVPTGQSAMFFYYWVMPQSYYNRFIPATGGFDDWSIATQS